MRFPIRAAFLCLASLVGACSSSPTTTPGIVRPTLIGVAPSDVFPMAPCGSGSQDLHGYLASLHDVTPGSIPDGGTPFELASSASGGPTPCERVTTFSFVGVGRQYVADVDGYARSDLHAPVAEFEGGVSVPALGSLVLLDPANQVVVPDWSARCGYVPGGIDHLVDAPVGDAGTPVSDAGTDGGDAGTATAAADAGADGGPPQCIASDFQPGGVIALASVTRYAVDCIDGVAVKLSSLWSCGGPGGIDHFEVENEAGLKSCAPAPCAQTAVLNLGSLTRQRRPGTVTFTLRAFAAGSTSSTPLKQATCSVTPQRGLVISADCQETAITAPSP